MLAEPLAALSDVAYDRERKSTAKRLGITLGVLGKKVKQAREHKPASAAERDAAIKRLADVAHIKYRAARKREARTLGMNVSDLDREVDAERRWRRQKAEDARRTQAPPQAGEVRWRPDFEMRKDGLHGPSGGSLPPLWLAAPFEVLGRTRDHLGEAHGLWLRWSDCDGILHTYPCHPRCW
jgi:hypothetical protein